VSMDWEVAVLGPVDDFSAVIRLQPVGFHSGSERVSSVGENTESVLYLFVAYRKYGHPHRGGTMSANGPQGASVEQLYRELTDVETASGTDDRSGDVVDAVTDQLFPGGSFRFDEELVKNSLDELLLVLVALRDGDTHGKGLMENLSSVFDARLSPGTVYPRLHDLEDEELLKMHELVRTKEYRIEDPENTRSRIEDAMQQHLALGFVFYSALEEL
jgi:hypothetical protein